MSKKNHFYTAKEVIFKISHQNGPHDLKKIISSENVVTEYAQILTIRHYFAVQACYRERSYIKPMAAVISKSRYRNF